MGRGREGEGGMVTQCMSQYCMVASLTSAFLLTMSSSSLETIGECFPVSGLVYSYRSFITTGGGGE